MCLQRLLTAPGSAGDPASIEIAPAQGEDAQPQTPQPVDWQALLASIDGDREFARDLADAFIGTVDRELASIAGALRAGDDTKLRESAHNLKGASANLRAAEAVTAAALLESAADSGNRDQFTALAERLDAEVRRTVVFLRSVA